MKKISIKTIEKILKGLDNKYSECLDSEVLYEEVVIDYSKTILLLLSEIRDLLSSKECRCSNLKTDPTKLKKNDILIGELE